MMSKSFRADIINLSFTSQDLSVIEHDAIVDAHQRGTICICASGNEAGAIAYTAAVSRVGERGRNRPQWVGTADSIAAFMKPNISEHIGCCGFFLRDLAIMVLTSRVARRGWALFQQSRLLLAAFLFTLTIPEPLTPVRLSLVSWQRCLANVPNTKRALRNEMRSQLALRTLQASVANIGLEEQFQGDGMPGLQA